MRWKNRSMRARISLHSRGSSRALRAMLIPACPWKAPRAAGAQAVRRAAVDERLELAGDPAPIVRGRDGDQVRLFHLFQNQLYVVVLHAFCRLITASAPLAEGIMQVAQAERLRFHPFFLKCVPDQFQQPGRVPVVLGARIEQQSLQFDISSIQSSSPFPRAAPAGGKSFP